MPTLTTLGAASRKGFGAERKTINGPATAVPGLAPPAKLAKVTDSHWPNTVCLVNTSLTYSGNNNQTYDLINNCVVTLVNSPVQGSVSPFRSGGHSTYFGSYHAGADVNGFRTSGAGLPSGTNNWTFSCWYFPYALASTESYNREICLISGNAANSIQIVLSTAASPSTSDFLLRFNDSLSPLANTNIIGSDINETNQAWNYLYLSRENDTYTMYINDRKTAQVTTSSSLSFNQAQDCYIGCFPESNSNVVYAGNIISSRGAAKPWGYITDIHIVDDYVPFRPVSRQRPQASANTRLFLSGPSGLFHDLGPQKLDIEVLGSNVEVVNAGPYRVREPYDPELQAGSIYVSGSNYAVASGSAQFNPSNDFTISTWVRPELPQSSNALILGNYTADLATDWKIFRDVQGRLEVQLTGDSNVLSSAANTLHVNCWHHIAVVRNSTVVTAFVNGRAVANLTCSAQIGSSTKNIILGQGLVGFMGQTVLSTVARYTENFTVPVEAEDLGIYDKLHLRFNYAEIFDGCQGQNFATASLVAASNEKSFGGLQAIKLRYGSSTRLMGTRNPVLNGSSLGTTRSSIDFWYRAIGFNSSIIPTGGVFALKVHPTTVASTAAFYPVSELGIRSPAFGAGSGRSWTEFGSYDTAYKNTANVDYHVILEAVSGLNSTWLDGSLILANRGLIHNSNVSYVSLGDVAVNSNVPNNTVDSFMGQFRVTFYAHRWNLASSSYTAPTGAFGNCEG